MTFYIKEAKGQLHNALLKHLSGCDLNRIKRRGSHSGVFLLMNLLNRLSGSSQNFTSQTEAG